ncbi:hypothetical protein K1719_026427 [Acacia pycnantha]|nr:hypothetical protein K1719_026427 [Acacia pycnantha]
MKSLESLDLSYNILSGEIPSTISDLSFLNHLNLSYNNFNGQIPLGTQIQSFDCWSFVGNPKLCGDPLPTKCNKKEETRDSKPIKFMLLWPFGAKALVEYQEKASFEWIHHFLVLNKGFLLQRRGSFAAMLPIELSFVILNLVNSTERRTFCNTSC